MRYKHRITDKRIFAFLLLALLFVPSLSSAAGFTYSPMEAIPGFGKVGDFPTFIVNLYKFGIMTIGIAAMIMIMLGGYMYITSAGNNASMSKAKGIITDAIIGLILAMTAFLLLYTINPELLKIKALSNNASNGGNNTSGNNNTSSQKCCILSNTQGQGDYGKSSNCPAAKQDGTCDQGTPAENCSSNPACGGGSSCNAAVNAGEQMKSSGCAYSMSLRNSCSGNPAYTDCSNFVSTSYTKAGCSSPGNNSQAMRNSSKAQSKPSDFSSMKAGDLIACGPGCTSSGSPGHVVMCRDNGCSSVIHASSSQTGIKYSNSDFYRNKGCCDKTLKASDFCQNSPSC